ncbi:MAG: hypothetical protein ACK4GT_17405 [Pararhodobacter sp.]
MSSFTIYLIGFIILVGGVAYAAFMLGVALMWIGVGAVILMGIGIITAVSKTRQRDAPPSSQPDDV